MHLLFNNSQIDYSKYITIKSFKKDEIVFNEGTICNSIGLVISGSVQISTITILENEYSISTILENDIFGSTLLFSSNPIYLGDGKCLKESKIIFITKDNLIYLLQNDTNILNNYLSFLANKRLQVQERLKILCQKTIKEKILFLLKSRMNKNNILTFSSKEKLALYLNIPRPSLSRELALMQQDGIIEYNKHQIILKKSLS